MDNQRTKTKLHSVLLKADTVSFLGEMIYYKLYLIRRFGPGIYAINVSNGQESRTCCFGKDRRSAMEIYGKIVDNTVTPCTLRDIAEDFSNKRKKCGSFK